MIKILCVLKLSTAIKHHCVRAHAKEFNFFSRAINMRMSFNVAFNEDVQKLSGD